MYFLVFLILNFLLKTLKSLSDVFVGNLLPLFKKLGMFDALLYCHFT